MKEICLREKSLCTRNIFFNMKDSLKKLNTGEKTFLGREKRLFTKENIFFVDKTLFICHFFAEKPSNSFGLLVKFGITGESPIVTTLYL